MEKIITLKCKNCGKIHKISDIINNMLNTKYGPNTGKDLNKLSLYFLTHIHLDCNCINSKDAIIFLDLEDNDRYELYLENKNSKNDNEIKPVAEMIVWSEKGMKFFDLKEDESWYVVNYFYNYIKMTKKQKKFLNWLNN